MIENIDTFNAFVIFLVNHGINEGYISKHESKLRMIHSRFADGLLPATVTTTKRHWILRYENNSKTRSLDISLSNLASGDVTASTSEDEQPRHATPELLREMFRWLYEDQERRNLAKIAIDNLESGFKPPYIISGYGTPQPKMPNKPEHEVTESFVESNFKSMYKTFRRELEKDGRWVIYIDTVAKIPGAESFPHTLQVDTQVLEKAFYFGEGTQPKKDGFVKRLKDRISRRTGK